MYSEYGETVFQCFIFALLDVVKYVVNRHTVLAGSTRLCTYIYVYVCVYIYIYIYIYAVSQQMHRSDSLLVSYSSYIIQPYAQYCNSAGHTKEGSLMMTYIRRNM
jgi:hypothetical protein